MAIVTPADGPSLGTAPAGTWMCTPEVFHLLVEAQFGGLRPDPTAACLGRFLHHFAQLAGEQAGPFLRGSSTASIYEHFAAGFGPGQPGGDARRNSLRASSGRNARGRAGRADRRAAGGTEAVSPSANRAATLRVRRPTARSSSRHARLRV